MTEPLLTAPEAAAMATAALGRTITARRILAWVAAGHLPAVELPSGRVGLRWADIEPLLTRPVSTS